MILARSYMHVLQYILYFTLDVYSVRYCTSSDIACYMAQYSCTGTCTVQLYSLLQYIDITSTVPSVLHM